MSGELPRCLYKERDRHVHVDKSQPYKIGVSLLVFCGFVFWLVGFIGFCQLRASDTVRYAWMAVLFTLCVACWLSIIGFVKNKQDAFDADALMDITNVDACKQARAISYSNETEHTMALSNEPSTLSLWENAGARSDIITKLIVYSDTAPTLSIAEQDISYLFQSVTLTDGPAYQLDLDYLIPNSTAGPVVLQVPTGDVTVKYVTATVTLAVADFYDEHGIYGMNCAQAHFVVDGNLDIKNLAC
jgi:hypothetical protein